MAKDSLPDSLELLLDTMCNTFGGIIFLAFSIALMLFSNQQFQNPEPVEEIDEQMIPILQQEIKNIKAETTFIEKKQDRQIKNVARMSQASQQKIQQIEDLNKKIRQVNEDTDVIKKENKELESKIKDTNIRENKNKQTAQQTKQRIKELEQKEKALKDEIKQLEKTEPNQTKVSFARITTTFARAYWFVVDNGKVYPLGTTGEGNQYIRTRRTGNRLNLILIQGIPIKDPVSNELKNFISSIDKNSNYCSFLVNPDSMKDFVTLRRYLREQKIRVNFSITDDYVLFYGGSGSGGASY